MKKQSIFAKCCLLLGAALTVSCNSIEQPKDVATHWVGTWGTAVQLTEPHNNPPEPGLSNNTIRQKLRVSIGGETLRLKLSNEFGNGTMKIKAINIAPSLGESKIDSTKVTDILFNNNKAVNIEVGQSIISDEFAFTITPRMDVAITIAFDSVPSDITGHPGSRTTSYILEGEVMSDANFEGAVATDHWYAIERIDVVAPTSTAAIAIIGNSITDGRGSTHNQQNRWVDVFTDRLMADSATNNLATLNMGIGGNCVVKGGLGPNALARFNRDVLSQPGVKYAIVFEGVNDIGGSQNVEETEKELIAAYTQMIDSAHSHGITIYGATISPFKSSFYYTPEKEACRIAVNNWIRTSKKFDGVIDMEKGICSANDTTIMDSTLHDNDFLHPNAAGHHALGSYINLDLFKK